MLKVNLEDGTTLVLPKPEGPGIQQLGIRSLYLNQRIDELDENVALSFVDDIIYLILAYWKEKQVERPFDRLHRLVLENKMSFDNDRYRELFTERVYEDFDLIHTYKTEDGDEKQRAKSELKARGFIGERKLKTYDKSFLRKAGIHI